MTQQQLKALFKAQGSRAPGYLRAQIEALLETTTSIADRSDWLARLARLDPTELSPRSGKMIFPVIMSGNDIPGALVTVHAADQLRVAGDSQEGSSRRVKGWLAQTLADWLVIDQGQVDQRLAFVPMTWRFGSESIGPIEDEVRTINGESMDLAVALALVGYLIQRPPHGAYVVSGALGDPGVLRVVGHCVSKRQVASVEAPDLHPERCVIVDAPTLFAPLLKQIYGDDVLEALATAFGQSAAALICRANQLWSTGDEVGAARQARAALELAPNAVQAARAHLILAGNAIHNAALDEAEGHFHALASAVAGAADDDHWFSNDIRETKIRLAVAELDRLAPSAARIFLEDVVSGLDAVSKGERSPPWAGIMAQAKGSLSRVAIVEGRLTAAITLRREALTFGGPQEEARSRQELATLLFLSGSTEEAEVEVHRASRALASISSAPARQLTDSFLRIVKMRWGLVQPSESEVANASVTAPNSGPWPLPSALITTLLAGHDETIALPWFEQHIFAITTEPHAAYFDFLVTACARAVAKGFTSPRWRQGPAPLVAAIATTQADQGRVAVLRAFVQGGEPAPVIQGCLY